MKGILMRPAVWAGKKKALEQYGSAVTRRKLNPQPESDIVEMCNTIEPEHWQTLGHSYKWTEECDTGAKIWKPKYQVGEVVYIKEAYYCPVSVWVEDHCEPDGRTFYKLDNPRLFSGYWKSPLFMPAWAACSFIKITDVRAERLQEITEEDCLAEGITDNDRMVAHSEEDDVKGLYDICYADAYARLWNSINKDYQWESNPWVFRYEFIKEGYE